MNQKTQTNMNKNQHASSIRPIENYFLRMKTKRYLYLNFAFLLFMVSTNIFPQNKKNSSSADRDKTVKTISLKAEQWEFKPQSVEFAEYKSRPAMKLLTGDQVVLRDLNFTDGTVEYDMEPIDPRFTAFYFRWTNAKESECFYFRDGRAGNPWAVDAIQYAPYIDGVNFWNMLPQFQTRADFRKDDWNHVKLVISGRQMKVFVNSTQQPALEVPILEGNVSSGTLAFDGKVIISNLIVKFNQTEGLSAVAGVDPVAYDPRYLRKWQVSTPITTEKGIDFNEAWVPNANTTWEAIATERGGLVNLTRKFGKTEGRRIVWLRITIQSDKTQDKMLHLGFNNEVWVLINDKPLFMDKNLYGTPMAKQDGRCSLENACIKIPLKEGDNHIMIGVANYFYGWGIIARLDNLDGIIPEK